MAVAQPRVAVAERGDLALVPYYTVRGQWVTGIHIVNTSDMTQVVKFRLRRATDGMNALDFNLVMSPKDVYVGFLSDDENGTISWSSPDTTCTAPATQGNRLTMPPSYRAGAESGYVEIIAMGQTQDERQPIAVAAKHRATTSMPVDCAAVRSNFFADGETIAMVTAPPRNLPPTAAKKGVVSNTQTFQPGVASASDPVIVRGGANNYVDSGNVLKVSYFIRDNSTGIEFGDNAVHIENFLNAASITNQEYGFSSGDLNGFDFPDLNGGGMPGGGMDRTRFNVLRRADVLGMARLINEWSANPANGVQMDWVVTLPGQYTMLRLPQYLVSLDTNRAWVPTVSRAGSPVENRWCPRQPIAANPATGTIAVDECDFRDLPIELEYFAYNREEFRGEVVGTLVPGPQILGVSATTYLPKVANVITFGGNSVLGQTDANVNVDLDQPFGWVEVTLKSQRTNRRICNWRGPDSKAPSAAEAANLSMACPVASVVGSNAPVIGFAAWSRQVAANPNASYGRIVEHSYRVLAPGMPTVPTAPTVPGAPTGLTAMPGNAQVALSWTAVNGATGYRVYYFRSPITSLTAPSVRSVIVTGGTSVTVTGLPNGTLQYFRVTATNAGGEGAPSNEASATPQVPGTMTAGTVFRDTLSGGGQGPQMVTLPTGSFQMGSPRTETGRRGNNEGPVRTVTISKRIAMGRYEVTFDDYDRFADATKRAKPSDSGWGRGSRPVINVSRNDAKAYAAWLSTQTGKPYRLPTEAEWEYAARAGTRTRYSWGDSISCSQARYGLRWSRQCGNSQEGTVPLGSFAANGFGLFDMHGNVWEWVEDCWHGNYQGAPMDGRAWTSGCPGNVLTSGVIRGGSWFDDSRFLRAASRYVYGSSRRAYNVGFRLVQDLNP